MPTRTRPLRGLWLFVVVFAAVLWMPAAFCNQLDELFHQYEAHRDAGRHQEMLASITQALSLAEEQVKAKELDSDDPILGSLLHNVGMAYLRLGKPAEADDYLSRGLSAAVNALGEDDPTTLLRMSMLAMNRRRLGQVGSAKSLHDRAVRLSLPRHDLDDVLRSTLYFNAGSFYLRLRELDKAEELIRSSLELENRRAANQRSNPKLASRLAALGDIQQLRGQLMEAADTFSKAIDICERFPELKAEQIAIQFRLGTTLLYLHDYDKGGRLIKAAFETARQTGDLIGEAYTTRATSYARLLAKQKRYRDGIAVLDSIPFDELGDDYDGTAAKILILAAYSNVWCEGGHFDRATASANEAIALLKTTDDQSLAAIEIEARISAGDAYCLAGKRSEAEKHYARAIHLTGVLYGDKSSAVAGLSKRIAATRARATREWMPEWLEGISEQLGATAEKFAILASLLLSILFDINFLVIALLCVVMSSWTKSYAWFWWLAAYASIFAFLALIDLAYPKGIGVSTNYSIKYTALIAGNPFFPLAVSFVAGLVGLARLARASWLSITATKDPESDT
jgi:tetratricopeptide (TPR) repeat protein